MRGYTTTEKLSYWLFADRTPVTKSLVLINIATFLAFVLSNEKAAAVLAYLIFNPAFVTINPWSLLTYPLVFLSRNLIGLLFGCFWMWIAGGSLERSWGSARYAWFFFTMSIVTAAGIFAGSRILGVNAPLMGLTMPLAGITVAFAMINPEATVQYMFFIPLKLKYLALITVVMVVVSYATMVPQMGAGLVLGVLALVGCAYAYWFVRPGRSSSSRRRYDENRIVRVYERPSLFQRLNPFRRMRDRKVEDWLRKQLDDKDSK